MSNITKRVTEKFKSEMYSVGFPAYSNDMLHDLEQKFTRALTTQINNQIDEYFEPFIRKAGVKGEITKGKLKWRGIKMYIHAGIDYRVFQLTQRGMKISPCFKVDFFGGVSYPLDFIFNQIQ